MITTWAAILAKPLLRQTVPACRACLSSAIRSPTPLEGILYTSCDEMRSLDYRHYDGENILDYIADYQPDVVLYVRDDLTCITTEGNGTMGLAE